MAITLHSISPEIVVRRAPEGTLPGPGTPAWAGEAGGMEAPATRTTLSARAQRVLADPAHAAAAAALSRGAGLAETLKQLGAKARAAAPAEPEAELQWPDPTLAGMKSVPESLRTPVNPLDRRVGLMR